MLTFHSFDGNFHDLFINLVVRGDTDGHSLDH